MRKVLDISSARDARAADALAVRAELLELAEAMFPGEQYIDQITQKPTLDAEADEILSRMFKLFGVTGLNPLNPDFDLVSNTWYELTKVGSNLRSRKMFEDTLYAAQVRIWHPDYLAYVNALWAGDVPKINACASALGITKGIPEEASRLRDGPINLKAKKAPVKG